ncbi:hypothetical protein AM305_04363 [Actinobacillus minor NM305]|uniref:Addiction module killer protein n=1 Tax=Actinobacillus minor NM305 TaxID=637911 RepID=C5RYU4_9PAST|nr:hypothetical protein AM305_04363 [Actinobacillus minor NM305]
MKPLLFLMNGGDKSTQQSDIEKAKLLFAQLKQQKKEQPHDPNSSF